ncbi:MAG TPA: serine hydrolase domain-containing protein [Acidobacteriaceae bacterium]|nr:serine hydrolase domain-containing protein [Acidobacteriaceae bacterium]
MPMPAAHGPLDSQLDEYVAAYMPAMNAPGLTLGLTDTSATRRIACYGYADLERHLAVTADHRFQIGSITKSFVVLVILQLHDEGKIDLHKPVLDYLPGLPMVTKFGPVTVHHLLTHTSGLPDNLAVFGPDPAERLVQGFAPGEHFHYCNAGFDILGLLATKIDGRAWRVLAQERILDRLGMTETRPVITTADRERQAVGYAPYWDDQVYARQGRLAPAPNLVMDDTAGCIASTPADMATYARMLLHHGQGPKGRIVSEESFRLMSTPHIKAEEFSETASYGYGIAVDTLDGHKILRHTGGMVAFASSIHVDLDGGVAAFASINAMQGYRPTAVTEYAVSLLRAEREAKSLPSAPAISDPRDVDNAADYAGSFTAADGGKLEFRADGKRLSLMHGGTAVPLQHAGGDNFLSTVPGVMADHTIHFGRKEAQGKGDSKKQAPVVEVSYGPGWYTASGYEGPHTFSVPEEYGFYTGRYQPDTAWAGAVAVYVRKGRLYADDDPLVPIGDHLFRVGDESWIPITATFFHLFEGKARVLRVAGIDLHRVEVG